MSSPPDIMRPANPDRFSKWVQTDRKALELWGQMIAENPTAARLLSILIARMGGFNAVSISQKTLAKMLGKHERTVQRAIADLVKGRWIQVVRMNGPGTVAAYLVNDRVVWGQSREELRLSAFSAVLIADAADQTPEMLADDRPLHRLPYPEEIQLPTGPGLLPPSQPYLDGLEPDLPATGQLGNDE